MSSKIYNFYMKKRSSFANSLILHRKKYGFTQEDLARHSGVSKRSIALYETKGVNPPLENIQKLAQTLNINIEQLVGFKKDNLEIDYAFSSVDSRTLKKLKQILSLTPQQRHMVYMFVDSMTKKNEQEI